MFTKREMFLMGAAFHRGTLSRSTTAHEAREAFEDWLDTEVAHGVTIGDKLDETANNPRRSSVTKETQQ